MTIAFFPFLLLFLPQGIQAEEDLDSIRIMFHNIDGKKDILQIIDSEIGDYKADPTILAYRGICDAMMAKYVFFPFSKLKYFNRGVKQLDKSIKIQQNIENTYLRILLQLRAPKFLNYKKYLKSDIQFFKENFLVSSLSQDIKTIFAQNLLKNQGKSSDFDFLFPLIDNETLSLN